MAIAAVLDRPAPSRRRTASAGAASVAGASAAAVALAAGELVTGLAGRGPSLVTAVGAEFIDRFAASLKDLAVAVFGTNDKVALVVGIVATATALGACVGVASRRRRSVGLASFGAFGALGAWAVAQDPQGSTASGVGAALAAVAAGVLTLRWLMRLAETPAAVDTGAPARRPVIDRRRFVLGVGGAVIAASSGAVLGRRARVRGSVETARRTTVLPRPSGGTPPPARQPFSVAGLAPYVTPNEDFYRIDTALSTPQVDAAGWRLRVDGLVDRPFELTYDDLLGADSVEETVTIACVSNEVGGRLVGNAVWQGVPLAALLERAGVRAEATQIVGRSVDGFTAGFPTADALDGRTALVAYAMNGVPLPADHGYPARLIVAGLYGYVSATKWLERIELTTWDGFDGYWVPRGWSKRGPIKTASRIDVPRSGETLDAGSRVIAGVAWAPTRGISRVEVRVDGGPWQRAELGEVASDATWVQWYLPWTATPGEHELRVRATDDDGVTQPAEPRPPAPDGATGWHRRIVRVR